jgi:hypothetical protein
VLGYRLVTSVPEKLPNIPSGFALHSSYPNPFNPSTIIEYEVPHTTHVKLFVHDVLGRRIQVLVDDVQAAGVYRIRFDAKGLSSGTYFYTMETPEYDATKQFQFVK